MGRKVRNKAGAAHREKMDRKARERARVVSRPAPPPEARALAVEDAHERPQRSGGRHRHSSLVAMALVLAGGIK